MVRAHTPHLPRVVDALAFQWLTDLFMPQTTLPGASGGSDPAASGCV